MGKGRSALVAASVSAAFLFGTWVPAHAAAPEEAKSSFSATLDLVSDYRFRGVSLSDRKPALQAGGEYSHKSGLFAGAWGSTIAEVDGADLELDLFVGYSGSGGGIDYSIAATKYLYPGAKGLSYLELNAEVERPLGRATLSAELAYTPEQANAVDSLYTGAGLSFAADDALALHAKLGRENGAYDRKWDWELGLVRAFGPVDLRASFIGSNHRRARLGSEGKPALVLGAGVRF